MTNERYDRIVEIVKKHQTSDRKLYDFGGGITVAPSVPDHQEHSHIFGVESNGKVWLFYVPNNYSDEQLENYMANVFNATILPLHGVSFYAGV